MKLKELFRAPRILLLATGVMLIGLATGASAGEKVTTAGKEFIFGFPANYLTQTISLFVSSEQDTHGSVEIPGLGFSLPFSIRAGDITTLDLPRTADSSPNNVVANLGVRVSADAPVQLFGLNKSLYSTDAFVALPVQALDTEYRVLSYYGGGPESELVVVGVQDGTEVTITPSVNLFAAGRKAGQPFSITLNRLQSFRLSGTNLDITGTSIVASAPVSVASGGQCAGVPRGVTACDHLVETMPPITAWGRSFATYPLAERKKGDLFRVLASQDGTEVRIDGALVATLNAGAYFDTIATVPMEIETSTPVLLGQYSVGQSYDDVLADPFMMVVPPTGQWLEDYVFATPATGFASNYVNVVIPTAEVDSVALDGAAVDPSRFNPIGGGTYSGAQLSLQPGSHSISADGPFAIFVYGFNRFESYGYPGGMAVDVINPIHGDYRNVRLTSTLAKNGIALEPTSFAVVPNRISEFDDRIEIEWKVPSLNIGETRDFDYELVLKDPVPGEQRLVSQKLELVYEDMHRAQHRQSLGEQYVSVLPSAYQLGVVLEKAAYSAGEVLGIGADIRNLGSSNDVLALQLEVQDRNGHLFSSLPTVNGLTVAPGGNLSMTPAAFNTTGMYAGDYRLYGRLVDAAGTIVTAASVDFHVQVPNGVGLNASLSSDKQVYDAWAPVKLSAHIINNAPNSIQRPTTAVLRIMRSDGTSVYTDTASVGEIYPNGTTDLSFQTWLTDEWSGPLTALLAISGTDGVMVASAMTTFRVERAATAGVVGFVDVAQPIVYRGDTNLCTETLTNFGGADISDVTVRHRLVAMGSGQVLDEKSSLRSLGGNETQTDTWSISTQPMAAGEYGCLLSVNVAGTYKDLALGGFLLKESPLKISSNWLTGAKGRLLILLDKAANDDHHCGHHPVRLRAEHGFVLGTDAKAEVRLLNGEGRVLVNASAANDGDLESGNGGDERLSIVTFDRNGLTVTVDEGAEQGYAVQATVVSQGNTLRLATGPMRHECGHEHEHGHRFGDFSVVHTAGAANDPHFLVPAPKLSQQRAMLESLLQQEGWNYTIVEDAGAFDHAFHHGGYTAYLLLSDRVKLPETLQSELVEAVNRGEGLLLAGNHDHRNNRLDEALGVVHRGDLSGAIGVTIPGTDWLNAGEEVFGTATRATRIGLAGATVIGRYTGLSERGGDRDDHGDRGDHHDRCDHDKESSAAVTSFTYGRGRAIYAGFDLLAQATQSGDASLFAELLRASTAKVHPDQVPAMGGMAIPLGFHLENQGMAVSGRVVVTLPAGTQVISAGTGVLQSDGTVIWPFDLGAGQNLDLPLLARFPAGVQEISAQVQTLSNGAYTEYTTVVYPLNLSAAPAWDSVLSSVNHLAVPKRGSATSYRQCAHELGKAKSDFDRKKYRDSLEHLTRAADPLKGKNVAEAVSLRFDIDHLLRDVGARTP